jgi:hypothetical protein
MHRERHGHGPLIEVVEHCGPAGMAGRYTGSYLDPLNGWRTVAILAELGQASLVGRIPEDQLALREDGDN